MKKAAIIIPIYENHKLFSNFLYNFVHNINYNEYRIIIAFDGSPSKKSIEYLEQFKTEEFNILETPVSVGFSQINNIALNYIKEDIIIFMNSDIIAEEKCLNMLINTIKNGTADLVQPLLIYPQSNTVQSTGHIFSDSHNMHALQNRKITEKIVQTSAYRQALSLALCAVNKSVLDEVGFLNEDYLHGWEGLEFTLKAHLYGKKCYYLADTFAYHIQGGSTNQTSNHKANYQGFYFWKKWGKNIKSDIHEIINSQLLDILSDDDNYLIIDLTDHFILKRVLKKCNVKTTEYLKISNSAVSNINLFNVLPYNYIIEEQKLLFLTHSFLQLKDNKIWFQYRNKDDICIDMYGNVIVSNYFRK